ncbi:MAG: hypothetical protein JSV99_12365 [Planctomycetota bacterium]|nr:MAG: hypothetical protein JSV99_12365 [Planctomycetota bacterium]
MTLWSKLFGKSGEPKGSAAKQLEEARCELVAIIEEDGRVANPIGQKILLGELQTVRNNLTSAVEALQNPAKAMQAGVTSYDVGVGLRRLCDATLNDPKWALQAAVGTERCRTRVAKVLRTIEEVADRLNPDTRAGTSPAP